MHMRLLIDLILSRCQTLGLTGTTQTPVDASAVELTLLHVLQGLSDGYDFETLTRIGDPYFFVTRVGERQYALPDDFQRFLLPKDEQTDGLSLHDGTTEWELTYKIPGEFRRQWSTTNGKPQSYTLLYGPTVMLDPPPDANSTTGYRGVGAYIRTITPDLLEGEVPMLFPGALLDMALGQLATDQPVASTPLLIQQAETARTRMLNAHARLRQQFQPRHTRVLRFGNVRG